MANAAPVKKQSSAICAVVRSPMTLPIVRTGMTTVAKITSSMKSDGFRSRVGRSSDNAPNSAMARPNSA